MPNVSWKLSVYTHHHIMFTEARGHEGKNAEKNYYVIDMCFVCKICQSACQMSYSSNEVHFIFSFLIFKKFSALY